MAWKRLLFCACLSLALFGCEAGTPEQRAQWAREASRPIVCTQGLDCDIKWGRALEWVKANSAYRITTYTQNIIATAAPKRYDESPAFTIVRIAKGDGIYRIEFQRSCQGADICYGSPLAEKASFVSYVLDK